MQECEGRSAVLSNPSLNGHQVSLRLLCGSERDTDEEVAGGGKLGAIKKLTHRSEVQRLRRALVGLNLSTFESLVLLSLIARNSSSL